MRSRFNTDTLSVPLAKVTYKVSSDLEEKKQDLPTYERCYMQSHTATVVDTERNGKLKPLL